MTVRESTGWKEQVAWNFRTTLIHAFFSKPQNVARQELFVGGLLASCTGKEKRPRMCVILEIIVLGARRL